MLRRDNFTLGLILGLIAPMLGFMLFKFYKFEIFSFSEFFNFILHEPGFRTLSAGLSVSLLMNAILFTIYINQRLDKTAKGVFITTLVYGLIILLIKTIY